MMTSMRSKRRVQRTPRFNLEYLDDRIVPSAIGAGGHVTAPVIAVHVRPDEDALLAPQRQEAKLADSHPVASVRLDVATPTPIHTGHKAGGSIHGRPAPYLSAKVDARLRSVYKQYKTFLSKGDRGTFSPTGVNGVVIDGPSVGVAVHTTASANFKEAVAQLQSDGLQVTQDSAAAGIVEGVLPIGKLNAVANDSSTASVTLPPNVGAQLQSVYTQYETFVGKGSSGTFSPTGVNSLVISGADVGISVHTTASNFGTVLAQLQSDGLQVTQDSAAYGIIDGMLPIGQLPTVATISSTLSITPLYKPTLN